MNIDLLFTETGDAGLIFDRNPVKKILGVVIDLRSGTLTIEYQDMDYLELNIPVEQNFFGPLDRITKIQIGSVKDGNIAQAYQVPFMFLDDPYRTEALGKNMDQKNPLSAFNRFIRACIAGQPVHREDLGDEDAMGCILGDAVPSALQFAPHLARQLSAEIGPKAAPNIAPNAPGMGLGGGGSSGYSGGGYFKNLDEDED